MRRYALKDDQWAKIKPLFPSRKGYVGVTAKDNSLFDQFFIPIVPVFFWRDLPDRFGDFRMIHNRFSPWYRSGVWENIFQLLAENANDEYAMIDSKIVRVHQPSAGAEKGEKTKPLAVAGVEY